MSKNKLLWSLGLILIVVISLPIAYAQTLGVSLFFILINALIVGIILFILQTFLIPEKTDPKGKTVVYTAIILGSLLIAFLWGRTSFIWQGPLGVFFSVYVIVNTIIISIFLYFLLGLLEINKKLGLESPQGQTSYGLLIFFISAIFAVLMGSKFVWQQETIRLFIGYLFGPEGILNPSPPGYRLWIFITSSVLLSFFFNGYLLRGEGISPRVNYALAIILSASLASAGYSIKTVVIMGEFVFLLVFQKALQGTAGNKWSWILSFFLVGWAAGAITYGTEYQGVIGGLVGGLFGTLGIGGISGAVGTIGIFTALFSGTSGIILTLIIAGVVFWLTRSWMWALIALGVGLLIVGTGAIGASIGLILLAILIPIGIFAFAISRAKGMQERRQRWRGVRNAYLVNAVGDLIQKIMPGRKRRLIKLRDIPNRESEIVYRNRLLFMRLLDQELRFDIFYTKYLYMREFAGLLKNETEQLKGFINQETLKKMIILLRSQKGKVNLGTDVNPNLIGEDTVIVPGLETYRDFIGWNYVNKIIVYYMNHLYDFFSQRLSEIERTPARAPDDSNPRVPLYNAYGQAANTKLANDIGVIESAISPSKGQYDIRVGLYPHHYTIKGYTFWIWDMYNMSWRGYHPYRFAIKGAKYIDSNSNEADVLDDKTEVNVYGQFADDIRRLSTDTVFETNVKEGRIKIRRLKNPRRDTIPFSPGENMGTISEYFVRDWLGFIRDFRSGLYHPFSRSVREYEEAWDQGIWKDDDITWTPRGGSEASPAFDLRVLADPGIYTWWGREIYNAPETAVETSRERGNLEPHISQFGIKQFILRLIDRTAANVKETKEFLSYYPADTGVEPTTIEEQKTKPVVGRFEERGG